MQHQKHLQSPGARRATGIDCLDNDMAWSFAVDKDLHINGWPQPIASLFDVSPKEALGRYCAQVILGKSEFGRRACRQDCPAVRELASGTISGNSHIVARTADGRRRHFVCELIALPSGGALGQLHEAGSASAATGELGDLADIGVLTTRVVHEPLQDGLRDALDYLRHATHADAGEAFLIEPGHGALLRSCHRGQFARLFSQITRFAIGSGFPGQALARRREVSSTRLGHEAGFLRDQVVRGGFTTYISVPLLHQGDGLGCLALAFRADHADLQHAGRLLHSVAPLLELAVRSARAEAQQQARSAFDRSGDDPEAQLRPGLERLLRTMMHASQADAGELQLPWYREGLRIQAPSGHALPPCPAAASPTRFCPVMSGNTTQLLRANRGAWPEACRAANDAIGTWLCVPMACANVSMGTIRLQFDPSRSSRPEALAVPMAWMANAAAERLRDIHGARSPSTHSNAQPAGAAAAAMQRPVQASISTALDTSWGQARLAIRCLGPLELVVDGKPVSRAIVTRRRVWSLLSFLLTHHDQPRSNEELLEVLWPNADPVTRMAQLYVLVHELRQLIEPHRDDRSWCYVRSAAGGIRFEAQTSCWVDSVQFEALVQRARAADAAGDNAAVLEACEGAMELYRGDYFQEQPFAEWCAPTRERLRQACQDALHRLCKLSLRHQRWDEALHWARRALSLDRTDEAMHCTAMRALLAMGRRHEARRQYDACTAALRQDLNLAPLPETSRLLTGIGTAA